MRKRILLFWFIIAHILLFFYVLASAETPKNYLKGKFYQSIKNNFLVATKKMNDPRFQKTVIIMLESDIDGAWGLVINKPIGSLPLKMLINVPENKKVLDNIKIPIFWGGLVDEDRIYILHSNEYESSSTKRFNDISLSVDYEILYDIAEKKGPKKNIVILGYSGWGDGQVEGEMEKDHWILSEIKENIIFDIDASKKWKKALKNAFIPL